MKAIDRRIVAGTQVYTCGPDGWNWFTVEKIESGVWIKIHGIAGLCQMGHIRKFSNKQH